MSEIPTEEKIHKAINNWDDVADADIRFLLALARAYLSGELVRSDALLTMQDFISNDDFMIMTSNLLGLNPLKIMEFIHAILAAQREKIERGK